MILAARICILAICAFIPLRGWAQLDADLIKGAKEAPQDEGLANGRYEIRKSEASTKGLTAATSTSSEDAPQPKKASKKKSVRKFSSEDEKANSNSESKNLLPKPELNLVAEEPAVTKATQPSVSEQVTDLFLGKAQPALQAYKEQVHPDDVRLNRLEINVMPGFFYNESKSTFSYKNYLSFSPYVALGAKIWLTPFIGIAGKYGTSMGADILESSSSTTRIAVGYEASEIGLDFRNFFGLSRRSNSLDLGLYYSEVKFSVPADNTKRVRSRSGGLGLKFEARIPTAPSFSWILGGRVEPRNSQSEMATGLSLQSGSSPQSSKVGVNLGGEIKMSRQHQLIFDLGFSVEKIAFSGSASLSDPETSQTPSGVSVTNTQALFSLGYRWGH